MTNPAGYYDRFDPTKEYDQHMFISGRGLQSAELNEIQQRAAYRTKSIADALFSDGDIIRDAQISVVESTGVTSCRSGAIYLQGEVRGIPPSSFTIPHVGTVAVGIRLIETLVTATQDPDLRDPAAGTRNYNEEGAERRKIHAQWAWDGDGVTGSFFPVYQVVDGIVSSKEPPPQINAVTQALARYDRDSAGGNYVVSGLNLTKLADAGGSQVYSLAEGRARVMGYGIEIQAALRISLAASPDLKAISTEPHLSSTSGSQRVNLNHTPATAITNVTVTLETTDTLTHGIFTGAQDPLSNGSVLQIIEVKQGGTTYTPTTDYLLTADKVDWTPGGAEPAPGSTYTCKYQYVATITPSAIDSTGFTVTGAVSGTNILVTYSQMLPRIDRLCLDADGRTVWIKGVAAEYYPQLPSVPDYLLSVAQVRQTWDANRTVTNDGVRVVPMPVLAKIESKFDFIIQLLAQQRLESSIHTRESGSKLGLFTDPFLDDSQRDAGTAQTAAIVHGELQLPIAATISAVSSDITHPTTCNYTSVVAISQTKRTGDMKINPYLSFAAIPAKITLTPSVDRWTVADTVWTSLPTLRFQRRPVTGPSGQSVQTAITFLGLQATPIETLRTINVAFDATGFAPNEVISSVIFDGVTIAV